MARSGMRQVLAVGVLGAALIGCAPPDAYAPPVSEVGPSGGNVVIVYDGETGRPVGRVVAEGPRFAGPVVRPGVVQDVPPGGGGATGKGGAAALRPRSSGTGFYVGARQVVTNAHVVAGCTELRDDRGGRFTVAAADRARDLALLRSSTEARGVLRFNRSGTDLGESVLVLGYPYAGSPLSTGLNLTTGIVSANAGLAGNQGLFQITAAVQPGNSGGPVLDDTGGVIGVVRARANDLAVLQATGTLPQNINFAIRGEAVEGFLRENGVTPERVSGGRGLSASAITAGAQEAVVSIRCFG